MTIHISGSLAFDRIMSFPNRFVDAILADKLEQLNVSFFIEKLIHKRGGTAGNIGYVLSLLGEKPSILATVGVDFIEYFAYLEGLGLPIEGIRIIPGQQTAGCYIITDTTNNQINGFHPAAMSFPCEADVSRFVPGDWAIISPGNMDDMRNIPRICREKKVRYIFDPGQQIPVLSGDDLLNAITGSDLLMTNDYELEMICRSTGKTRAELRALTGHVITTHGAEGTVIDNNPEDRIAAVPVSHVADPTGAGDAMRAGLLKGLVCGLDLHKSLRLGSTCAAYCVESEGTQEFRFTQAEFADRHKAAFNEDTGFTTC